MNSREKGKRGERQWRDELRAHGYQARRGQQFAGGADSPDVICDALSWIHFEVKLVERLDLRAAMEQARRDGHGKAAFVAHRRNFWPWLVTMEAERFYRMLATDKTGRWCDSVAGRPAKVVCAAFTWLHAVILRPRCNVHEVMAEVRREAEPAADVVGALARRVPVVIHERQGEPDLITMEAETFFKFLGGELPPGQTPNIEHRTPNFEVRGEGDDFTTKSAKSAEMRRRRAQRSRPT